jgi:hypothetical protein
MVTSVCSNAKYYFNKVSKPVCKLVSNLSKENKTKAVALLAFAGLALVCVNYSSLRKSYYKFYSSNGSLGNKVEYAYLCSLGKLFKVDYNEARRVYKELSKVDKEKYSKDDKKHFLLSSYNYALMCRDGLGDEGKDLVEARAVLKRLANLGELDIVEYQKLLLATICYQYGLICLDIESGDVDVSESRKFLKRASDLGIVEANKRLDQEPFVKKN